jgi:hypothetical protein
LRLAAPTDLLADVLDWIGDFDWWEIVLGIAVGVLVYLITDANRRPNLTFDPQTSDVDPPRAHTNNQSYRRLHVHVTNERRIWPLRWMDRTANYARCYLHFKDPDSGAVIRSIDGRWASGREPVDYLTGVPDYAALLLPQREILVIGESFGVDVAIKFDGNAHFYAFNNRSYLPSDDGPAAWSHKDKRFDQDHLLVEIEIRAEGLRKRSRTFLIRNPNQSLPAFEIAES